MKEGQHDPVDIVGKSEHDLICARLKNLRGELRTGRAAFDRAVRSMAHDLNKFHVHGVTAFDLVAFMRACGTEP